MMTPNDTPALLYSQYHQTVRDLREKGHVIDDEMYHQLWQQIADSDAPVREFGKVKGILLQTPKQTISESEQQFEAEVEASFGKSGSVDRTYLRFGTIITRGQD